jgi:hypothetical protein
LTVAHPSDLAAADTAVVRAMLDRAETRLRLAGTDTSVALTRSHTGDFRTVGWYGAAPPGWALAIDAEVTDATVPPALAARYGRDAFWGRWTRAESLSKVFGVPIALWLRWHGLRVLPHIPALWRTLTLADLTISVACARGGGVPASLAGSAGFAGSSLLPRGTG